MTSIEVYQYDFNKTPSHGGDGADSENKGTIIMGYSKSAGSGTSSIYYMPYSEYIVQGGEDYHREKKYRNVNSHQ